MRKFYFLIENLTKSKIRFLFMLLTISQLSWAQSTTNYAFETNATGSLALDANGNIVDMSTGTTQLVGAALDAAASAVTNIGFNFVFMGSNYSQFSVNEDGQLKLGSVVVGTNSYALTGGTATAPLLSAINADFRTGLTTGKIHYKLVGTAPNRTLVVEFKDMQIFYTGTAAAGNSTWQMRFYETSGIIQYVYGTVNATDILTGNRTPTIGFYTGATNNLFASVLYASQTASTTTPYTVNPIINAIGDFTGLSSATNGSRREYKFTSPVPAAGPTGLAFSGVTSSTTTLNWTAAAPTTNIIRYIVLNSTNGGATYNFVANVALGTNTYAATALTPGTTYDWKVIAVSEGAESTPTIGTQATSAAAAYYWVGTTGGNWNTPANWNTAANNTGSTRAVVAASDILIVDGDGTTAGGTTTINVDLASFTVGQLIVNSNTNLSLQSNNATTRTITMTGGVGDDFTIEFGSTLNLSNTTNAVAIAFSGTGNTGLIAGTLNVGGAAGNVLNSSGGTGTLVTVATTGIINNSFAGTTGVTGTVSSLSFLDGSAYNALGATTTAPSVPLATWATNSTLTISGLTTSTTAPGNNNQSFGNIIFNCPALTSNYPFFVATTTAVVKGNLSVTTGSGQFRALSSGTLNVLGNVNVLAGRFVAFTGAGTLIVGGNTTISLGSIFDLSLGAGLYVQRGATFTNNGTINGPNSATASTLYFFPIVPIAQTWNGTGTVGAALNTISLNNTSGLTISQAGPITILRANLFSGNITGSNNLTIGTGLALACLVQVGSAGLVGPGGAFVSPLTWNLGTGTYTLLYSQCDAYTATNEIPPSRTVTNVTLNNTNGVTLSGGNLDVSGTLTLTAGNFTTNTANLLSLGTATVAGTLTGGSPTSYINGPFARTIASANANTNYILYPVGKTAYAPVFLAPATTAVSVMKAEAFDSNSGTANAAIISLSANRRWETPLVSGTITDINVRLADANLVNGNIPVQANSAAGQYTSSFGSTATFAVGTPNTIQSNATVLSTNFTGFLSYAVSNACSGTPTPGLTTATSTTVCLGGSTTLGITSIPVGSGVTYQWQSSTDGVSYSDVVGAISSTYVASPIVITYYQCIVTCTAGPSSATSTPIQITFTNNVAGTTPGARCGTGTVTLGATPNSGATINWYANASGGTALDSGNSFVIPSISGTTTYYAASTTSGPQAANIGTDVTLTGATAQPTAFCNRWTNYWSQTIYTAAELKAAGYSAGNIASMSYNITTLGDAATNPNFTVKIGTVAGSSFASATFLSTATYTTVYGPSTYTHTASGLQTITFATPYVWDGVSNIVVNVTHDGANATNNSQTYYTATTDNKVLWATGFTGSTTTGTTSLNRLNVVFSGQAICESPRVPVVATVNTPPTLTLSTATAIICAGDSTSPVTITVGSTDYDTYVWSPLTGVTGNSTIGWTFNPSQSTSYTLTASQSGGTLCSTTANVNVTVNGAPAAVAVTPATAAICSGTIQQLDAAGGTYTATVLSGSGTSTSSGGVTTALLGPNPFQNFYGGTKQQWIYTAAELTALGFSAGTQINEIKLDLATANTTYALANLVVKMKNTGVGSFASTTAWETGLTTVKAAASYTPAVGLNSFVLDAPFTWNGTSNLVIEMNYSNNNGGATSNNAAKHSATSFVSTIFYRIDNQTAATVDAFVGTASYTYSSRNDVTFVHTSVAPITWSPLTDLYTDSGATIAYTGTPATTVYTKPTADVTYTATATLGTCSKSDTSVITVTANSSLPNEVVSVCDTYTWAANGTTYTTSGIYTSTTSCVTRTLDLTITSATISGATPQVINGGVAADATIEDIVVTSNGTVTWFASSADATANINPLPAGTQLVDGNIYYGVTNIGICRSTTLAVTVTVVLGNSSFDLSQLTYYPNPVKDIFNVKYNKEIISVDVYDLTGRKVIEMKPNTLEVQLDMTNLSNAMYIVRLQSVDGMTELKVYKN